MATRTNVHAAESASFDLHPGRASVTLYDFSAQGHVLVLFNPTVATGVTTNSVVGRLEPVEALTQLLANTGLTFISKDEGNTFVVISLSAHPEADDHTKSATPPAGSPHASGNGSGAGPPQSEPLVIPEGPPPVVDILGTHIHGSQSVGVQPTILDKADIRNSGAFTIQGLFGQIPENFGGVAVLGMQAATNSGLGTSLNPRGLGSSATLILVDGRRIAPSGTQAAFADVANIPLALVKRVEFFLDGASALYGSDAVAGVVNIVLEHDLVGAETIARVGSVTQGSMLEHQFAQLIGLPLNDGHAVFGAEDYRTAALQARDRPQSSSNMQPRGPNQDTSYSNSGTAVIGGTPWKISAGQNGSNLKPSDLMPGQNLEDVALNSDVTPSQHLQSLYAAGDHALGSHVRLFGSALWTQRHALEMLSGDRENVPVQTTSPYYLDPVGQGASEVVQYDFAKVLGPVATSVHVGTRNFLVGANLELGPHWQGTVSVSEVQETERQYSIDYVDLTNLNSAVNTPAPGLAFDPFGDASSVDPATVSALRSSHGFDSRSQINSFDATADGLLMKLAGGDVKAEIGTELRKQTFRSALFDGPGTEPVPQNLSRKTVAAFTEVRLPLVGPKNQLLGVRDLELSFASRYEHSRDFPYTMTPRIGLHWGVTDEVELHGTWDRSVRDPNLGDLDEKQTTSILYPLDDPRNPGSSLKSLVWFGNNADLHAERATTGTFGATLTFVALGDLHLDLTYYNIAFRDRIEGTSFETTILSDPRYQSVIDRNPGAALRQRICSSSTFAGAHSDCLDTPIDSVVDLRLQNIAELKTSTLDLTADSQLPSPLGKLSWSILATYILDYSKIETPTSPDLSLLNTSSNPIDLQLWGALKWDWRSFNSEIDVRYSNHYRDNVSVPNRNIASWTTFDWRISYLFGGGHNFLVNNTEFSFKIKNALNKGAPFVVNYSENVGYDEQNASLVGRTVSLSVYHNLN